MEGDSPLHSFLLRISYAFASTRVQRSCDSSKTEIPYFGIMTSGLILENGRFLINPPYYTNDV
jgi:hypothetical protein